MTLPLAEMGLEALRKSVRDSIVVAEHWRDQEGTTNWQRSRLSHLLAGLQTAEHCVTQLSDRLKADAKKAKGEQPW